MNKAKENDVKELIVWLEKDDNDPNGSVTEGTAKQDTPLLLKLFTGKFDELDEDTKKRYKKYIDIAGKTALFGLTGIGSATLPSMLLFNPLLFLNPVTLAGSVGGVIAYNFISKKIKSKEGKALSEQLEQLSKKFIAGKESVQKKLQENAAEMERVFSEYTPLMLEKIKTTSEHVAIQLDDLVNMDQNKRIMQYQKIALNQYQEQKAIWETLKSIKVTHDRIMKENAELIEKLKQYQEKEKICYQTNELLE